MSAIHERKSEAALVPATASDSIQPTIQQKLIYLKELTIRVNFSIKSILPLLIWDEADSEDELKSTVIEYPEQAHALYAEILKQETNLENYNAFSVAISSFSGINRTRPNNRIFVRLSEIKCIDNITPQISIRKIIKHLTSDIENIEKRVIAKITELQYMVESKVAEQKSVFATVQAALTQINAESKATPENLNLLKNIVHKWQLDLSLKVRLSTKINLNKVIRFAQEAELQEELLQKLPDLIEGPTGIPKSLVKVIITYMVAVDSYNSHHYNFWNNKKPILIEKKDENSIEKSPSYSPPT